MDRRQKSEAGETKPLSKNRLKGPGNKVVHQRPQLGNEAFKEKYLQCCCAQTATTAGLRNIVKEPAWADLSRTTMVKWATDAGDSKSYAASLLSRILCSVGMRESSVGAGRNPSRDALKLLEYARSRFGDKCLNVQAAWRAGKAQLVTDKLGGERTPITVTQLDALRGNSHLTQRLKKIALNGKHFRLQLKKGKLQ